MNNKINNIILEVTWIITGILSVLAIFFVIKNGYSSRIFLFVLTAFISFLFAWFHHKRRIQK